MSETAKMLFAGIVGGLVSSLLLFGIFVLKKPCSFAVGKVDMQGILKAEARSLSALKLPFRQEQEAMKQVMGRLHRVLSEWPEKRVLLDSSAVISLHVPEYTEQVRQKLRQEEGTEK